MPRDYTTQAPQAVRRRDRAVTDEAWIRAFLHTAPYGALATAHEGQPFINSNLFVYDEPAHVLYLHTARVGRTQGNVQAAAGPEGIPVCFAVFRMGRLLPADTALEFSVEYAGVHVFGRARVLGPDEHDEARRALQLLLDKYAPHLHPGRDYRAVTDDELARTAVFRIDITAWSGKEKRADPDFPGAFTYAEPPGGGPSRSEAEPAEEAS